VARWLSRAVVILVAIVLAVTGVVIAIVETGWAKDQLRGLVVRQANQYLAATLEIGRLEGSLFRGLELGDVTLSRDGHPIITIEEVSLSYSPRELWQNGTVVRRIVITRPRVVAAKQPDGRWDLADLVKRDARQQNRTGPGRAIEIQAIELIDASITLRDPFQFGAAHLPTEFRSLNASLSFAYAPVHWTLVFDNMSWIGHAPELTVTRFSGKLGRSTEGWFFDRLAVETARSAFTLSGQALIGDHPTTLDLAVHAAPFAFQEWSGVLTGLKNIAVEASFDTTLKGPLTGIDTRLALAGTGGSVKGRLTLDTKVPGWHGAGAVDVDRINLARWLNRPDRPSDVTGHVVFDLDLDLGKHFPRGSWEIDGPHAMYLDYAADDLHARGRLTATEAQIDRMTAVAYGARLPSTTGSIGLDDPYPYHFRGAMAALDLRLVPKNVPVPHVGTTLALDYDVMGRFRQPFIKGHAQFAQSEFLGAIVGEGTIGTIDTETRPILYSGEGEIQGVNLNRFGAALGVGWLGDPRYAGSVSGRFRVDGAGADVETLALRAAGRLSRGDLFHGALRDADVSLEIDHGTLHGSFGGSFAGIDPAIAFVDPRLSASLTGSADVRTTVRDLLTRTPSLADYEVTGRMSVDHSTIRAVKVDAGTIEGTLASERLSIARLNLSGPVLAGTGSGIIAFNGRDTSDFQYDLTRADLTGLRPVLGGSAAGLVITKGRLTGPATAWQFKGDGTMSNLDAFGISALTTTGQYDVTIPSGPETAKPSGPLSMPPGAAAALGTPSGRVTGRASFMNILGQTMQEASGTISLAADRADFNVTMTEVPGRTGVLAGAILLHGDRQAIDFLNLTATIGTVPWRLVRSAAPPTLSWSDAGLAISPTAFVTGQQNDQQVGVAGTWRYDGGGSLHVTATHAFLDTFQNTRDRPARYGGVMDLDAIVRGTRTAPLVSGTITISSGRIERVAYEKLAGRVDYSQGLFDIDMRLDQAPGTWLTAKGKVPMALFNRDQAERPIDLAIQSSPVDLGLLAGVTEVVSRATGQIQINVRAIGTSRDPHFDGAVDIANAGFLVVDTGVQYKSGRAAIRLTDDRITVESLHLEDEKGQPLEIHGSLGTHELRVGDLAIDVTANRFDIVRNEFGRVNASALLLLRGQFEAPRLSGDITINGDELKVDSILERTLFHPYATEQVSITSLDAVAALNPWAMLGLDVTLKVPKTLRLTGSDIQVSSGTPIGLGDINMRVGGDLYLYKDPGQPLSVTGSLDQVSGTYVFQGRRFDIDEADSSINFAGDLDPQLWVTVVRDISGVQARVTVSGSLHQPELRLASVPPLDQSDILSLIVFNTTPNSLSAVQQQELAVRAGTLAAGFLAKPLLQAVQNELGLDTFAIEPSGEFGTGPKVTIGDELAPGLVARFSRQFGQEPFDEATVEYYLSRLFRLRATFSDAQSIVARSTFRRVERAGIDLLVFFSF
jgi:autotransporter translocation and assembly factor TamB